MARLNVRMIETLREKGPYGDGGGLHLVVSDKGAKKWIFRFQVDGRRRDMGLGSFPAVSLAMAREKARAAKTAMSSGSDPIVQRRHARLAKAVPTFRDVAAEVIRDEQAKSTNDKVRYQWSFCSARPIARRS